MGAVVARFVLLLLLLLNCVVAQDLSELAHQHSYNEVFSVLDNCKQSGAMKLVLPQIAHDLVDIGAHDLVSIADAEREDIKEISKKYKVHASGSYYWLVSCICSSIFDHYLLKVSAENKVYRDEIEPPAVRENKKNKKNSQNSKSMSKNKNGNQNSKKAISPTGSKKEMVQELYLRHDLCVDYKSQKHNKFLQKDEL